MQLNDFYYVTTYIWFTSGHFSNMTDIIVSVKKQLFSVHWVSLADTYTTLLTSHDPIQQVQYQLYRLYGLVHRLITEWVFMINDGCIDL